MTHAEPSLVKMVAEASRTPGLLKALRTRYGPDVVDALLAQGGESGLTGIAAAPGSNVVAQTPSPNLGTGQASPWDRPQQIGEIPHDERLPIDLWGLPRYGYPSANVDSAKLRILESQLPGFKQALGGGQEQEFLAGVESQRGPFDPKNDVPATRLGLNPGTETGYAEPKVDPRKPPRLPSPGWLTQEEGYGFTGGTQGDPTKRPTRPGAPPPGGVGGSSGSGKGWVPRAGGPPGRPPQAVRRTNEGEIPNETEPYPSPSEWQNIGSEQSPNSTLYQGGPWSTDQNTPWILQMPGHAVNQGETPPSAPLINTGVQLPLGPTDQGTNWIPLQRRGPSMLGGGQDTPDQLWDKDQTREQQGAMTPTLPPHDLGMQRGYQQQQPVGWQPPQQPQQPQPQGAGTEMGAGGVRINGVWREDLPDPETGGTDSGNGRNFTDTASYNQAASSQGMQSASSTPTGGGDTPSGGNQKIIVDPAKEKELANSKAAIDIQSRAEDDRHQENMARLDQEWKIHQDDLAYNQAVLAENTRHNQATEDLNRRQQDIQLQIAQLNVDSQERIQKMADANRIQIEAMQEGNKILLQQGDQAFKDWQSRQAAYMNILGTALNNPWLQRLSGMAPPQGEAGIMGGGRVQDLIQQILQPFDYSSVYGAASQLPAQQGASAGGAAQGAASSGPATGGPTAGSTAPDWATWQGWSPFQKAAYRTDVEAQGPGAWQTEQDRLNQQFTQSGGSANVTQLAAQSASPADSIGQQMNAEVFGQTPQQWGQQQQKMWSAAQAPTVKQNMGISATGPSGSPASATVGSQFGI